MAHSYLIVTLWWRIVKLDILSQAWKPIGSMLVFVNGVQLLAIGKDAVHGPMHTVHGTDLNWICSLHASSL